MPQKDLLGQTILGYTVTDKLGSGAFGTVYKVVKSNQSGTYTRALKHITIPTNKQYSSVLNSMGGSVDKTNDYFTQMLNNIISEVRILNDLSEKNVPNVVRYYENDIQVTESPRRYDVYILMEYLNPLEEYIYKNGFTVKDVVQLGIDILKGLDACHINGIIHRDVKIDNIFVTNSGEFKIGDFGVSKVLKDTSKAESMKGTPDYLAPEIYLGKEGYNKSIDLYSLGIVLYRLLNYNRNPFLPKYPESFISEDEDKAFSMRMRGAQPDLPQLGGEEIGKVIIKAISNKNERYKTAKEFSDALSNALNKTSTSLLSEKVEIGYIPEYDFETIALINQPSDETIIDVGIQQKEPVIPNTARQNIQSQPNPQRVNPNSRPQINYGQYPTYPQVPRKKSKWPWIIAISSIVILSLILIFFIFEIFVDSNVSGPVSAPTYTMASGDYYEPINVQIKTFKPDQFVFYTLDGSKPSLNSYSYSLGQNIYIASTTTIKSIAVDMYGNKSAVATAYYNILIN